MNIQNVLKNGIDKLNKNNIEESNLKAKILLCYILNVNKEYLIINSDKELTENQVIKFDKYIDLLIKGKPIQYVTNKQEFMGLEFYVDEKVLIPQPDTEILVETAIQYLKKIKLNDTGRRGRRPLQNEYNNSIKILDLCTGSGAIAISITKYMSNIVGAGLVSAQTENINKFVSNVHIDSHIIASDISDNALQIAKQNAIKNNVLEHIKFIKSDMFENINEKFDMIVSNPPYIETDIIKTLSKEVQNEPIIALDGGQDGLGFYKIIANEAYKYLNNNGLLIVEIGYKQKEAVVKLLEETGMYENIVYKKDYSNNDRIIMCSRN